MALLKMKYHRYCIPLVTVLLITTGCSTEFYQDNQTAPQPNVTISPLFKPDVYPRIATLVVDNTRDFYRNEGIIRQVEDEFMRSAIQKGYTVAARSDVENILEEQDLQRSNLTEEEIAKAGQILNVPAMLIVSINNVSTERVNPTISVEGRRYYSTTVNVSARLISADLAQVLWLSSYTGSYRSSGRGNDNEAQYLPVVAEIVASGLPGR